MNNFEVTLKKEAFLIKINPNTIFISSISPILEKLCNKECAYIPVSSRQTVQTAMVT